MVDQKISRNSLAWLLIAQSCVLIPHAMHTPLWVVVVCICCALWRLMIFQGRWQYPSTIMKVVLVFVSCFAVLFSFGTVVGLEAGSAILLLAFYLKLLEIKSKRDIYLVIYLAYFLVFTQFLFDQSIMMAILMLLACVVITSALIGLNQYKNNRVSYRTFKASVAIIVQSIPMMIVLFVFVPRIPPLWSVDLDTGSAITGMSSSMTPGDIARLSQSDELAFRVSFKKDPPKQAELYWRAMVFSDFDGRTWSQDERYVNDPYVWWAGGATKYELINKSQSNNIREVEYDIIQEPTQQRWLFSLKVAEPISTNIGLTREWNIVSRIDLSQPFQYSIKSYLDVSVDKNLPSWLRQKNLVIPYKGNPKSQLMAKKLRRQYRDPEKLIESVLMMFNQQEFHYTLKPPLLGGNNIDDFLFESRRGFCEHFSGSFVYLMRAAGVPARVVVGYQGGEYNQSGDYYAIRQFDAHAWAEVWLKDKGWVRVDPTAAVAPERIEQGLEQAVAGENSFLEGSPLSVFRYRSNPLLTAVRLKLDAINYNWNRWVLGYKPEVQSQLIKSLLGDNSLLRIAMAIMFLTTMCLGVVALYLLVMRMNKKEIPVISLYQKFCKLLAREGIKRNCGEGPVDYANRAVLEKPEWTHYIKHVTSSYIRLLYQVDKPADKSIERFNKKIKLKPNS